VVVVERVFDVGGSEGEVDRLAPLGTIRVREVALSFERVDDSADALPASWITKFPTKTVVNLARRLAADLEYDAIDERHRPPMPRGTPPRRDADGWYREFGRAVLWWERLGFGSKMDIYREVADRKGVALETVKGWAARAWRMLERDAAEERPAVAMCAACGGPIYAGAVGMIGEGLYHPGNCAPRRCKRMVIDERGELTPLT
jgi:hypothetical protein